MKYKGVCPNCGNEFETNNEHKKYCDPECGIIFREKLKKKEDAIKKIESEERMRNDPRYGFCNNSKSFFFKGIKKKACENCTCGFIPIKWESQI